MNGARPDAMRVFLPWAGFNGKTSKWHKPNSEARRIAAAHHPAWSDLSETDRKLHARNSYIVLGHDLSTPVSRLICWTLGGRGGGGTGQAIRVARAHGVPVFDLAKPDDAAAIAEWSGVEIITSAQAGLRFTP